MFVHTYTIHISTCPHIYLYIYTHVYTYIYINIYICVYIYTHTHVNVCTYIYHQYMHIYRWARCKRNAQTRVSAGGGRREGLLRIDAVYSVFEVRAGRCGGSPIAPHSTPQRVRGDCVLQYAAVCCSVLKCVAVCCSVLQCVAVCCSERVRTYRLPIAAHAASAWWLWVVVCCSILQCVAVCCSVL